MVKKPFRGKYLELKVRVSYDEKTDSVHITSKDKDLPTERGFHLTLNGGKDAEYILRTLLEKEGLIPEDRFKVIPTHLCFDDAINTDKWDKFPLGLHANGEEAVWDSSRSSNLLLAGSAGTGKSVIQRNIIFHCLRHPEKWVFFGIDLRRVALAPYLEFGSPITNVATTVADALEIANNA
jgi:DNA segregation ATPase FtsK/SpoIIIE-like protein